MRFLITLTLFLIAFFAIGQNQSTKISDTEKKRLENEFKALGTFYIDDSGLVVYQNVKNTSVTDEKIDSTETIEEPQNIPITDTKSENEKKESFEPIQVEEADIISPPSSSFYKKKVEVGTINTNIKEVDTKEKDINQNVNIEVEESISNPSIIEEPKKKKGSVLNQRRTSQYKTMEEAALAVEALLDELRKEENKTTTSGSSMSSKLSRGVSKDLRKSSNSNNTSNQSEKPISKTTTVETNNTSFGVEPSYFINGKQVDKIEVSKLRKEDVIRREIRVRNTVTGNPNGEVWYEVK